MREFHYYLLTYCDLILAPEDQERFFMQDVRALVFDVFGTVVDWRNGVARQAANFLAKNDVPMEPTEFADAWRRRYQPAMEAVRSGQRPFVRLDILHRENLEAVLTEAGVDVAAIDPQELAELNLAWHRLDPWPDVLSGLARLKDRFIIAPLSNGNIILMLDMARRAGIPWHTILGAEVVQAYKPAPAAYLRTVDLLAMRPEQVCMVAAHNNDLAAARACGLKTTFVLRPTEHGASQTTDLHPEQDWEVTVDSFEALADALGA
ncbi:haloacid dehalogenase type II [Pusillimonas sp. MFBS29]|uniref:haloacid dehalogenase type II n=1 Tax=Pusillimonas sp. MFBS29 TaxID=2886690 RepID=UPI00351D6C6D